MNYWESTTGERDFFCNNSTTYYELKLILHKNIDFE